MNLELTRTNRHEMEVGNVKHAAQVNTPLTGHKIAQSVLLDMNNVKTVVQSVSNVIRDTLPMFHVRRSVGSATEEDTWRLVVANHARSVLLDFSRINPPHSVRHALLAGRVRNAMSARRERISSQVLETVVNAQRGGFKNTNQRVAVINVQPGGSRMQKRELPARPAGLGFSNLTPRRIAAHARAGGYKI